MACWIAKCRPISPAAVALTAAMPVILFASGTVAQTLTDPNPSTKWSPPQTTPKSHRAAKAKSCNAYGAGFVNVPGTDACVKIGGWVTVEGSAGR